MQDVSNTREGKSLGHLTPLWAAYSLLVSFLLHFLFLCTHQVTTATMIAKTTTPPITAPITTHGGPSKMDYKMGEVCHARSLPAGLVCPSPVLKLLKSSTKY